MNNTVWSKSFLFLFQVIVLALAFVPCGEIHAAFQTDSLNTIINKKTGVDKIKTQLDFALELANKDSEGALRMANSAHSAAKTSGNKKVEMISYYTLGRISMELENIGRAQDYLDSALTLASAINDHWYKGEILYRIGVIKHRKGETLQALESFNASIQSCRLSDNFKIAGSSYSMMGTIFRMDGMYDRAIEYIIKSKLNYEKAGFVDGSGWAAYLLGRIYYELKLPQKALEYFQESLDIYIKTSSVDGNMNGLALCYEQIGIINMEAGNFEEARKYITYTSEIHTANESKYGMSNVKMNLGKIEYYEGNYALAENYLNESLQIKKEINDLLGQPRIYEYNGLCLIARGNTNEGLKSIRQGLDLAISNNQKKIQLDIYARLTEAYLSINDFENAIINQDKQIEIQNSILSGAANIKTEQLQAIYEIDEKNSQIAELEKQNEIIALSNRQNKIIRNIMISGIILALLVALVIYWFYKKIKIKNHELYEANSAKDKFFAIIAHDLRGPTSSLAALLELINSKFNEFSISDLKNILLELYKSAQNVSNLLENLLIWAQSQVDKIEYRPTEIELDNLLQSTINGLTQSAENKQINIRIESKDQIFVMADSDMLQTIVRNVLNNAIKYSHRGGLVLIKTELKKRNTALVKIIDNGVGIEKDNLTKIFEITNKHHTTGTENEKSTGLGLILVKEFVERNKGTLTIESELNKGTTVSFTLPVTQVFSPEFAS